MLKVIQELLPGLRLIGVAVLLLNLTWVFMRIGKTIEWTALDAIQMLVALLVAILLGALLTVKENK